MALSGMPSNSAVAGSCTRAEAGCRRGSPRARACRPLPCRRGRSRRRAALDPGREPGRRSRWGGADGPRSTIGSSTSTPLRIVSVVAARCDVDVVRLDPGRFGDFAHRHRGRLREDLGKQALAGRSLVAHDDECHAAVGGERCEELAERGERASGATDPDDRRLRLRRGHGNGLRGDGAWVARRRRTLTVFWGTSARCLLRALGVRGVLLLAATVTLYQNSREQERARERQGAAGGLGVWGVPAATCLSSPDRERDEQNHRRHTHRSLSRFKTVTPRSPRARSSTRPAA